MISKKLLYISKSKKYHVKSTYNDILQKSLFPKIVKRLQEVSKAKI